VLISCPIILCTVGLLYAVVCIAFLLSFPYTSLGNFSIVINKTVTLKTKTKTETEAPKHKRNVNIIESQIKAVMYQFVIIIHHKFCITVSYHSI